MSELDLLHSHNDWGQFLRDRVRTETGTLTVRRGQDVGSIDSFRLVSPPISTG